MNGTAAGNLGSTWAPLRRIWFYPFASSMVRLLKYFKMPSDFLKSTNLKAPDS